jgi:hypothetical protein
MLYKSTALSFNQRWTMYQLGNILLYRSTKPIDLKSTSIYKMLYSSTNFFVVVVDAFTILSSLCSTGQQLFILICSAVQPTQIIQYVEDASECRRCYIQIFFIEINKKIKIPPCFIYSIDPYLFYISTKTA